MLAMRPTFPVFVVSRAVWLGLALGACREQYVHAPSGTRTCCQDAGPTADAGGPERRMLPDLRLRCVGAGFRFRFGRRVWTRSAGGTGSTQDFFDWGAFGPLRLQTDSQEFVWPQDADAGRRYASGDWEASMIATQPPIEPLVAGIQSESTLRFEQNTQALIDDHALITSLDFATANEAQASYGLTSVRRLDGAPLFDTALVATLKPEELQMFATAQASSGRIITALAGDGETLTVFAFDWLGTAETYEARIAQTSFDDLEDEARVLAGEGYVITALGRNAAQLLLVGTRPAGSSSPLEIEVWDEYELPRESQGALVAWAERAGQLRAIFQR